MDRFLGLVIVLVVACDTANPSRATHTTRDSSGITIVENVLGEVSVFRLSEVPTLDIGSDADSATTLYQVEGAHRLSDGRIVVANRSSHELRYYDAGGRFLSATGRKGAGPGEFEYIAWTTRCGTDSLYAYDIGNRRLTVFDESGTMIRMHQMMLPGNTLPYGAAKCQRGGPFLSAGWPRSNPTSGYHRPEMPVGFIGADGAPHLSLGMFPGVDRWGHVRDGRITGSGPLPLGRSTTLAMANDAAYVGTADSYELRVFGLDGKLNRVIRLTGLDRSIAEADVALFIEEQIGSAETENQRRRLRRDYEAIEFPTALPAYRELLVDDSALVWVQDYPRPGVSRVTWRAFDADGIYVAVLDMPVALRVFEIGIDYVAAVVRDEFDVEHVQLWGLLRST